MGNNPLAATDPTGLFLVVNPAAGGPCIPCDVGIGILDIFSLIFDILGGGPPPQAAPAPQGGYGAGIDPYGTWDEAIPNGVQVFPSSVTGIPNGSGCTYGSGSCGGMIYGFTLGVPIGVEPVDCGNILDWLLFFRPFRAQNAGLQIIQEQRDIRDQCVARADAVQTRMNDRNNNGTNPILGPPPGQEPSVPEDNPVGPSFEPPQDNSAWQPVVGWAINSIVHRLAVNDCVSQTPIVGLP